MNNAEFQEMQRLEGELSQSEVQRIRRAHQNPHDYLVALRREYKAVCEAIQKLSNQ